jgi:hypothetical protein
MFPFARGAMKRDAHRGTRRQGVGLGIDLDSVAGLQAQVARDAGPRRTGISDGASLTNLRKNEGAAPNAIMRISHAKRIFAVV